MVAFKGSGLTYSSRKEVSLHSALPVPPSVARGWHFFESRSSKGLQLLPGAVTGVTDLSELTDVRSVLRSNDVQDESEEKEELVSTHSSNNPCLEPMTKKARQNKLHRREIKVRLGHRESSLGNVL
ncbi:hypothetical protein GOODEAATRI_007437 [Goodea atripinnis]|uniref:Uncharacterized protein n=1 Tax=Goodea atripinnis TaxID=208336 RepID=A0ABV0NJA1_9TELE